MSTICTIKKQLSKISLSLLTTLFFTSSYAQFAQFGGDIDGEAISDYSGRSVSMPNATTIAVGAGNNDGNGTDAGHVRIYNWDGSSWIQKGLDIDGEAAGDLFGESLSMPDTNTIAIGARRNDGNGSNSGHVRVYSWDGSSWVQKGLDIDGEAAGDFSGYSVSMPDSITVAIGARVNDDGATNAGHVRVYRWNGSSWVQKGADIDGASSGDYFGHAISMPNAETIAVSSVFANPIPLFASQTGKTEVYTWNGSSWVLKGSAIYGDNTSDNSGYSVDMPDENTLAIGAILGDDVNGDDAGNVKVFEWSGSAWTQKGSNIDGEDVNDFFGNSVSMPDANTIAAGAPRNDNCGGSGAGDVRVFGWNGSDWVLQGTDINGEGGGDRSGWSVDMPDVNTLAIGAVFNNEGGTDAGHARVYTRCVAPDIPSSISASSSTICAGVATTISWNGALNDASEWAVYAGSCGCSSSLLVGTTTSNSIVVNPTFSRTYYIRGIGCNSNSEGGCGTPITITVVDNPPTLASSPGDIDVVAPTNTCSSIVNYTPPLFDDDCDGNGLSGTMTAGLSSGSVFPVGTTTVTYEYTDGGSQTIVESFDVTVTDNDVPAVSSSPVDIIVTADPGTCGAVINYTAVTFDDGACGTGLTGILSAGLPSGSLFPIGTTTVIHEYTDLSNNMVIDTFDVVVTDDEAPLISGIPGDISIPGDSANCSVDVYWTAPTASDNCSISSFTSSHISGDIFTQGTTTVSYTAEDASGNITTLSFDVTVTTDLDGTVAVTPETTGNDGEIDLSATGGIMPPFFLYNWTGPNGYTSDNQDLFNLTSGLYEVVISDLIGCVDTISVNLPFDCPPANTTDVQSACDSYTWIDGNTYSTSTNTPTYTTTSVLTGCDSIITLDLTITNSVTWTDVQTACGSYTWIDGNTYSASTNTPTYTTTSVLTGCDSIITLDLTITSPSTGVDVQTSCGNFTWIDGNTYASSTSSPTYTISNGAANGCDSIVTLDLTINNSSTETDVITACDSYTWIDGNTYTTSNNTATVNLTNAAGCDSIVTLDLTINNSSTETDVITACDSYTWIDGNTYTASNNTATFTLTNAAGCDSIVTLDLTINNSNTGTDVQTACDSYTWIDGNTYTASNNTATWTLTNAVGCDSIVTLDLTINNSNTGTDVQTACDSYTWMDGNTYYTNNNSATYVINGGAANGCDSIVTLNLTVNPMPNTDIDDQGITLVSQDASALYQWLDCNNDFAEISGETSMSYTPDTTGSYAVKLDLAGCVDTSVCFFVDYSDLEEVSDIDFKLYPNPTNELFTVEFADQQGKVEFKLLSTTGQLIERRTEQNFSSVQFKIASEPGVYFLEITFEDEQKAVLPIIKQ